MVLKELVLNSLEKMEEFRIDDEVMTNEVYEKHADREVASWCVYTDEDARFGYFIDVTLEDY